MLVEVLVSAFVLLVGMAGAVTMIDGANRTSFTARGREGATNLERELIERARSIPYTQLTPNSIYQQLQAIPGLEDVSPSAGYQLRRRGHTYTVTLGACSQDDPKDSLGIHDAGSFCAGSAAGTADRNPDDYKLVTVDLAWADAATAGTSHEQTEINNPGNAAGPGITGLSLNPLSTNNVITSPLASLNVSVTVAFAPVAVSWTIDGVVEGDALGAGTAWSFSWPIQNLVDGTYLVGARAFDASGRSGPGRALTVTLNRFLPAAPTGLAAGRNGAVVELEWLANRERDIAGYRVYRGGTLVASCPLSTDTTCQDTSPPGSPLLTYTVVALDRDPVTGILREGAASLPVTVTLLNNPPNAPTGLTASTNSDGATALSWNAPVPADPDSGDSIDFYRIYRDGTAVGDRYDRTALGSQTTFVDGRNGGTQHTYWVTAVDTQLAESAALGPVTR